MPSAGWELGLEMAKTLPFLYSTSSKPALLLHALQHLFPGKTGNATAVSIL